MVRSPASRRAWRGVHSGSPWLDGLLAAVLIWVVVGVANHSFRDAATAQFRSQLIEGMRRVGRTASALVDRDSLAQITEAEQTNGPLFEKVAGPLRAVLRSAPEIKYVYTARVVGAEVRFGVDCAQPGDHDGDGRDDQAKVGELYEDPPEELLAAWHQDRTVWTEQPYTDEWGTFVSLFEPVRDDSERVVAVIGVDVDVATHNERMAAILRAADTGMWIALVAGLGIGLCVTGLRRTAERAAAERAASARALLRAKEEAESASRAKTAFLANMSHEIRTPMTAVLGFADVLADELTDGSSPARRQELLDTIRANGRALLTILDDVLDLGKIESGKLSVDREPTRWCQVAREVCELYRPKAAIRGVAVECIVAPDAPEWIHSDPVRLRQILLNLVGNAVKFTSRGHVRMRVGVDATDPAWLSLVIEDTGIGMSDDQVARLFRPFEQADATVSRRFGGTGLGLSIAGRLVGLLGGRIEVVSRVGHGSTFSFRLPAQVVAAPAAAPVTSNAPVGELAGRRVLVVDDGADNRRLFESVLRRSGAEVVTFDAAAPALAALAVPGAFDVVLMDLQMPEIDGLTAVRMLRERGSDVPVVAVTACAAGGSEEACLAAGCNAYETKPIQRAKLIATVVRLAQGRFNSGLQSV
ncbi:MAG: Autoinducer 2 sensor kinase/phosphatase LuxQ [Planctomycetota bacterium]